MINLKGRNRSSRSVDEPTFTQCGANQQMLIEPFIVGAGGPERQGDARSVEEPMRTVLTKNSQALIEPFLVNLSHTQNNDESMCKSLDNPLNTICGKGMFALLEPFLVQYFGGATAQPVDEPIPTITANYEHYALAEPFLIGVGGAEGQRKPHDIDEPLRTVTGTRTFAVAEPFIIPCAYGAKDKTKGDIRHKSLDEPIGTITGVNNWAFVEPFLVRFNNNQGEESIDEPLKTLTTKDRYGLCIPQIGAVLDIRFRMLQPHELAAAMSFPKGYSFIGTRDEQVKQIGNAVPRKTAAALCKSLLSN